MTAPEVANSVERPPALAQGRLERLVDAFGLSDFERELVQLCFALETDASVAAAVADLSGANEPRGLPIGVAHRLIGREDWIATARFAALKRWHVIRAVNEAPRVHEQVRLADAVTDALLGLPACDADLAELLAPLACAESAPPDVVATIAGALARRSSQLLSPLVCLRRHNGAEGVAAVASALGMRAFELDPERLAASRTPLVQLQRVFERDSALDPALLILECPADPALAVKLAAFVSSLAAHVIVLGDAPPGVRRHVARCEWPARNASALDEWRRALGREACSRVNGSLERVAAHFQLAPAQIAATGECVREEITGAASEEVAEKLLWTATSRAAWPQPGPLARVVEPRATLSDLVVPASVRAELDAIPRQVRYAGTVYERWGFAERAARGRGVAALFAGPSGTGKTMAAEAIAHTLELPLVITDFSQLRSKWVGETAKHAAKLFDELDRGGAVLLIDEADGLLGRRGAVVEANDNHSNADVAYFLQRLESFRGLAILTTNHKAGLDDAFLRRYRFVIDFPLPGYEERQLLWRRAFPPAAPLDELDASALARLPLTGGVIRNAALNAAFAAAEAGVAIGAGQLREALRAEYRKLERSEAELDAGLRL